MGATKSLLEEALTVRAPGLTEATDLDSSSEADDDIEQSTPEVRKRPASAISTGSKKKPRRVATSKPAGVPKPIRHQWVSIKLLEGWGVWEIWDSGARPDSIREHPHLGRRPSGAFSDIASVL